MQFVVSCFVLGIRCIACIHGWDPCITTVPVARWSAASVNGCCRSRSHVKRWPGHSKGLSRACCFPCCSCVHRCCTARHHGLPSWSTLPRGSAHSTTICFYVIKFNIRLRSVRNVDNIKWRWSLQPVHQVVGVYAWYFEINYSDEIVMYHILRHDWLLRTMPEGQIQGKKTCGGPRRIFFDWLLKTEEATIGYEELKMLTQGRSMKVETSGIGRILRKKEPYWKHDICSNVVSEFVCMFWPV